MNVIELFAEKQENEKIQTLVLGLHELIISLVPQVQASIKWKIPFYHYHKNMCYLNPQKDHIDLGFVKGHLLSNSQGLLEKGNRKQIRHLNVYSTSEIYQPATAEIILEAALINESLAQK